MRGRRSRAATLEDIAEARGRAAETISELAEHAVAIAREAGKNARPTVKHGAEGLSHALERAAGTLAETAEHLSDDGRINAARGRIADASDKVTAAIRPKKKTHRIRNLLIGAAVIGGIFALVQSPLRSKIQERLFGPPPEDDDLPQITLPDDDHEIDVSHASDVDLNNGTEIDVTHASDPPATSAAETEPAADVVGTPVVAEFNSPPRPWPQPRRHHRPGDQCLTTAHIRDARPRTGPSSPDRGRASPDRARRFSPTRAPRSGRRHASRSLRPR